MACTTYTPPRLPVKCPGREQQAFHTTSGQKRQRKSTILQGRSEKKNEKNVEHKRNYGLTYSLPPFFILLFFLSRTNAKSNIVVIVCLLTGFRVPHSCCFVACDTVCVLFLFFFLWVHSVPTALTKAQSLFHGPGVFTMSKYLGLRSLWLTWVSFLFFCRPSCLLATQWHFLCSVLFVSRCFFSHCFAAISSFPVLFRRVFMLCYCRY